MNFKKTVIRLFILSLVSTSALAATQSNSAQQDQQYSAMNNDAPAAKINLGFLKNVKFGGYLAVDAFGQTDEHYLNKTRFEHTDSQSGIALSAAALNIADQINSWIGADLNLFAASGNQPVAYIGQHDPAISIRYYPGGPVNSGVDIDEAYINVANYAQSPVALRAGQFYLPYGQYDRYAIAPTLTQQLTEIREDAVEVAYVGTNGLHGAVYGFKGIPNASNDDNLNNYGTSIGYTTALTNNITGDFAVGYLSNMLDVGTIADSSLNRKALASYHSKVGGWDGYATVMSGPFTLGIQYTSALSKISTEDVIFDNAAAKPSAGTVLGTYAFTVQGYATKLSLDYGWTDQAFLERDDELASLYNAYPKSRTGVEYDVNVLANTMVSAEVHYDNAYGTDADGTGDHSLTGTVRLAVNL
jgi:hypothetical protein